MTAVLEATSSILDSPPTPAAHLPEWFRDFQTSAWTRFREMPMPTRKDETWRFSKLKKLDFADFVRPADVPDDTGAIIERSRGLESPAARFVFINDRLIEIDSQLPDEVICMPLAEALITHSDLVQEHFMRHDTRLGSAKWSALHAAHLVNGLFVYVPDKVEVEGTIEVFHWLAGEGSTIFPHTLVVTGSHAKVRVIDYFESADEASGLAIAFNDLCAGPGSKLDYHVIQNFNEATRGIFINDTGVARDATATAFILNVGGEWVRNESLSRLEGEGSRSDMLSASVPARTQEYDQRTFQHHVSPGAYSDLLYKNSLYDKARTIFSGLIFVDDGAHRTDAYQTCRNLFMSDEAEANSMPGLEINADEVKCSHGSTSSQISDEEIFYLRTRGIDAQRARQLIARGFSIEAIERLGHEPTENLLIRFLDEKFARMDTGGA